MHYVNDPKAIREAEDNVADTRLEIQVAEIDKSISRLEELRDKEKDTIDDIIQSLEDYKEKWNDVFSAYGEAQEDQIAAMLLGQGWESDILDMRADVLANFAENYIHIQQAIADAAWESANAQIEAQKAAMNAANITPAKPSGGADAGMPGKDDTGSNIVPTKKQSEAPGNQHEAAAKLHEAAKEYYKSASGGDRKLESARVTYGDVHKVRKFHSGLEKGLVDEHSFDEDFELVQKAGLGENEVPVVLKKGEAVMTQDQVRNIASELRGAGSEEDKPIVINGVKYRPLQPGDRMYELKQKFDPYLESIGYNIEKLAPSSLYDYNRRMQDTANQIVNSNIVNNNTNVQPVNQTFNITMPNVTDSTSAAELMKDLQSISRKKFQVNW